MHDGGRDDEDEAQPAGQTHRADTRSQVALQRRALGLRRLDPGERTGGEARDDLQFAARGQRIDVHRGDAVIHREGAFRIVVGAGEACGPLDCRRARDTDIDVAHPGFPVAERVPVELVELRLRMVLGDHAAHRELDPVVLRLTIDRLLFADPPADVGRRLVDHHVRAGPGVGGHRRTRVVEFVPVGRIVGGLLRGEFEVRPAAGDPAEVHREVHRDLRSAVRLQLDGDVVVGDWGRIVRCRRQRRHQYCENANEKGQHCSADHGPNSSQRC